MTLFKRLYGEMIFVILVFITGVMMSLFIAWNHQNSLWEKNLGEFEASALDRIELITDKINHNSIVLRSLAVFFRASTSVDHEEFATFSHQLLTDYPYIHALDWIPRVPHSKRDEYETHAAYPDFEFREYNDEGVLVRADKREEYFPVYYVEPATGGNAKIIGFDVSTSRERVEAMLRAHDTRDIAVTERVKLLQVDEDNIPGVLFYEPIFKGESLHGFVASIVPLAAMVNAALKPLNFQGVNIVIHDLSSGNGEPHLLFVRSTRLKNIPEAEIMEDYRNANVMRSQRQIDVGGRKWQITILPARGYFSVSKYSPTTFLIVITGVIFTGLLASYMIGRIRENERISRLVEDRTLQLAKIQRETEMILLSTHEGIMGVDADGKISFCNLAATELLGFSKSELIGNSYKMLVHQLMDEPDAISPIQQVLEFGKSCTVRDDLFWKKNNGTLQVEYAASPIYEDNKVAGAVLIFRDIAEQLALEKKLEHMAQYDQLTGLANRTLFMEHLRAALLRADRAKRTVAVIFMDLNGFKPINDTLGHAAGDDLLKQFAEVLKDVVRDSDIAARMGGDEFVILADNLHNKDEALKPVFRLKERLKQPFTIEGREFPIGASVGIAYFPDHSADYEELVSFADEAMYAAKRDKSLPYAVHSLIKKKD